MLPSFCSQLLSQDAELKAFLLLWSSAALLFPGPLRYSLLDLTLKVFVKNFFLFHEVWQRSIFRKTLEMMFSNFPFDSSLHLFFFSCSSFFFHFMLPYRKFFFFFFPPNISSCMAFLAIAVIGAPLSWYQHFPCPLHLWASLGISMVSLEPWMEEVAWGREIIHWVQSLSHLKSILNWISSVGCPITSLASEKW